MNFPKLALAGMLTLSACAWSETVDLKPGSKLPASLVKGKTNLVEFYADW